MINTMSNKLTLAVIEIILLISIVIAGHSNVFVNLFSDYDTAWKVYHGVYIYWFIGLISGYFVGKMAQLKGYNFYIWFLYGQFLPVIALTYIIIKTKTNIVNYFTYQR